MRPAPLRTPCPCRRPARFPGLWLAFFLTHALALAACGREPAPAKLSPLAPGAVVLAFGDSLTHGSGAGGWEPAPGLSYPEALAGLIGRRVVRSGVPGETSERGLARLPGALAAARPSLALILHGGNDLLRGQDPEATRRNLEAMARLCQEAGAQVLLLAVPRPGLVLKDHPLYAQAAANSRAALAPDILAGVLSRPELKADPLHPNAQGYAELARQAAQVLRRLGALP